MRLTADESFLSCGKDIRNVDKVYVVRRGRGMHGLKQNRKKTRAAPPHCKYEMKIGRGALLFGLGYLNPLGLHKGYLNMYA